MRMPRTGGGVMESTAMLLRGYVTYEGREHTPITEMHNIVCNTKSASVRTGAWIMTTEIIMKIMRGGMMWSSDWRKYFFSLKEIRAPLPPSHSHPIHPEPLCGGSVCMMRQRLLRL